MFGKLPCKEKEPSQIIPCIQRGPSKSRVTLTRGHSQRRPYMPLRYRTCPFVPASGRNHKQNVRNEASFRKSELLQNSTPRAPNNKVEVITNIIKLLNHNYDCTTHYKNNKLIRYICMEDSSYHITSFDMNQQIFLPNFGIYI